MLDNPLPRRGRRVRDRLDLLAAGGGGFALAGELALFFGELFLARGVGLLNGALRMDAVQRVRSLAAHRTDLSADRFDVKWLGLLGIHNRFTV